MQGFLEQTSSESEAAPAGVGAGRRARLEGPWSASARALLAAVLMIAGAVLAIVGGGEPVAGGSMVLVLDPNAAPAGALSALPGVGADLIGRILAERRARPFASPADLRRRTPGVGPTALARLAPHLRIVAADRLARAD